MGRSLPSPIRLSSPEVFRTGGLSIGASGGPFAAFRASIGAGRAGADDGREVDHPPADALPERPPVRRRAGARRPHGQTVYGPPMNTHCSALDGPAAVRISTKRD
jgi:hypothetical protein